MFVICTSMRSIDDCEDKYSASTLADVLVDVPASLAFADIISYVLNQLQLLKDDMFCAKGEVIIANWRPLPIETICQVDRTKTVGDILLQIASVPTLKLTLR